MKKSAYILFFLFITLVGCENDLPDPSEKIVLQGFLYANEKVDDIRLTKLIPYGGQDTVAEPVNDAFVTIEWRGTDYLLVSKNNEGYYHYIGNELEILEGESYKIEFDYFGRNTWAETTIPPKPENFRMSGDSIIFSPDTFAFDTLFFFVDTVSFDTVNVRWDNPSQDYYFVSVDRLDQNARKVRTGFFGFDIDFAAFTEPTQSSSYSVGFFEVSHYGPHAISVYRINDEYLDLYENRDQDSRNLKEPPTNVVNGLGIFTGFYAVRDTFYVDFKP